jgi:hypothetical protein
MNSRGAARNRFGNDPTWLDGEAGGLDLMTLVFSRLADRRDPDVGESAGHELEIVRK